MQFARLRRRFFYHYRAVRLFLLVGVLIVFVVAAINIALPILKLGRTVLPILIPKEVALNNTDGRTNILILGVGGGTHDGPDLTDSIGVLSFKSDLSNKATPPSPVLISLPRDIYLDELQDKINSAYSQGKEKSPQAGMLLAKSVITRVTGLPIHYVAVIDFSTFEQAIDQLGGVDVEVENTFDDYMYPLPLDQVKDCVGDENAPCWYEHVHFEKGLTHMDGKTALIFARSRHAQGPEGSDFARAKRQQLVIQGIKSKVISLDLLLHPQKINDIYNTFKSHIVTDVKDEEFNGFFNLALKYKSVPLKTVALGEELFINPPIDERGWILLPKDGDFSEIHGYISTQIASLSGQVAKP